MGILDTLSSAVSSVVGTVSDALGGSDEQTAADQDKSKPTQAQPVGKIRVQYYRSAISTPKSHKQIVRSFGITKLNQIVERPDTDATRGAVRKVPHLLRIVG